MIPEYNYYQVKAKDKKEARKIIENCEDSAEYFDEAHESLEEN